MKVTLAFEISSVSNASSNNVVVQRTGDEGITVTQLWVYANDVQKATLTEIPKVLEKKSYTVSGINPGDVVKVYAVMNNTGKPCEKNPVTATATNA
jgi:hypothetical protein